MQRSLPTQAATGQTYGEAGRQIEGQRAVPLAPAPSAAAAAPSLPPGGSVGGLVPLDAPTQRPTEPLTAGIEGGPGPGPEALRLPTVDPLAEQVRGLYLAHPTPELRALLDELSD